MQPNDFSEVCEKFGKIIGNDIRDTHKLSSESNIIMDLSEMALLMKMWPLFVGFITLVIVLAKMHATIQVLEEKVKVAFQLINKLNDRK